MFTAFSRCLFPMQLTVIHTYIHTLMVVAAMQGADQQIRSSLEFSILPKDTSTCRPGDPNQRPSDNKMLALPLSHSRPWSGQVYKMIFIADFAEGHPMATKKPCLLDILNCSDNALYQITLPFWCSVSACLARHTSTSLYTKKQFVLAWPEMSLLATQRGCSHNKCISVFSVDWAKDNRLSVAAQSSVECLCKAAALTHSLTLIKDAQIWHAF